MMDDTTQKYSRTLNVPVYDVGPGNTLKLGSALRLIQETSEQHLFVSHISYEELLNETGLVFFIISTRVKIGRFPRHNERVTITTLVRGRGGAEFYRDFLFRTQEGELLLSATQTTVLADLRTRKVQRPQALEKFGVSADMIVPKEERLARFTVPDDLPQAGERLVTYSDLDANGHMNNAVYGDIVWDFIPADVRNSAKEIQINYLAETGEGDTLKISAGERGGKLLMRGANSSGLSFTCAAF